MSARRSSAAAAADEASPSEMFLFAGSEPSTASAQTPTTTSAAHVTHLGTPLDELLNSARPKGHVDCLVEAEFDGRSTVAEADAWSGDPARGGVPSPPSCAPCTTVKRPSGKEAGEGGAARQSNTPPAKKAKREKNAELLKERKTKEAANSVWQQANPEAVLRQQITFFGAATAAPVANEEDTPVRQEIADQDYWIVRACLGAQVDSATRRADRAEASLAVEVAARVAADARAEIAEDKLDDMRFAAAAGRAATRWAESVQNELTELRAKITELHANAAA